MWENVFFLFGSISLWRGFPILGPGIGPRHFPAWPRCHCQWHFLWRVSLALFRPHWPPAASPPPAVFPLTLAPLLTSLPLRALPPVPACPGPHPLTAPPAFPLPRNAMALCLRLQIHFILFFCIWYIIVF